MKLVEIFELKNSPDDELDRIIMSLNKKGFTVRKIDLLSDEIKKYPEIVDFVKSGKSIPVIKYKDKIISKEALGGMATF